MTLKMQRQGCGVTYSCYPSHFYHYGEQHSDFPWGNNLPPIQNHVVSVDANVTSGSKDEHETLAWPIWPYHSSGHCNWVGDGGQPGLGRSLGGGHGNPLQYSCLENSMDRGAWRAIVHRVTKSWTWLSNCIAHRSCWSLTRAIRKRGFPVLIAERLMHNPGTSRSHPATA